MNASGLRRWAAALMILATAGAVSAQASLTINFNTLATDGWVLDSNYWFTGQNDALDAGEVEAIVKYSPLELLYKANVGKEEDDPNTPVDETATTEEGVMKYINSYTTQFFNEPLDPADATISYVGPSSFIESPLYLVVKDGDAGQYLFNVTSWDRVSNLAVVNFFPGKGAISHVAIFGGEGVIPEPTMLLVWSGLAGLALQVRRRRV